MKPYSALLGSVEKGWTITIKNRNGDNTPGNHLAGFVREGRGQGSPSRHFPYSVASVPGSVMGLVLFHQVGSQTGNFFLVRIWVGF